MTKHRRILNLICQIRNSHTDMPNIFRYGSCLNFFLILRNVYPDAKPYFNIDHIITKIDGHYYDITGSVSPKGYSPYHSFFNKKRTSRSFTYMYNYQYEKLNNMKIQKIVEVVKKLNQELESEHSISPLGLYTNGEGWQISFFDSCNILMNQNGKHDSLDVFEKKLRELISIEIEGDHQEVYELPDNIDLEKIQDHCFNGEELSDFGKSILKLYKE